MDWQRRAAAAGYMLATLLPLALLRLLIDPSRLTANLLTAFIAPVALAIALCFLKARLPCGRWTHRR